MKASTRVFCLMFSVALASVAHAEDPPATPSNPLINTRVVDKLIDMGNYLRSLPKFQVDAEVTRDSVLESGQKIKTQSTNTLKVLDHNRFYAKADGDVRNRELFYNGKQLTQYAPFLKYYTTVDAPPTLSEALHLFEEHYGIQVPMEDLFLFGSDQSQIDALKEAAYVGPSTIDGKLCDHLAFRQEGVDWQLWITRSQTPLPCKLVITTTDAPSFPEYSAVYRWNLKPQLKESMFTFKPGKGDAAIPLKKVAEQGGQ
ncbi:DUF2092 domain-containing protein [Pseudomonas sp. B21-040]|jgi:hypothetical protein|uniref:DUF2092 domain-containing protein n=1 Tax=Pseudomonas TaxID=286 RepID=UPI0005FAD995|nr:MULTISPECIES: DUF2092 domain-containing protein [Pseudomonas]KJZ33703.1 hypothetical protein VC33_26690 [Pseudomonas fluorescens]OOG10444.1 hypothetical protein BMS17_28390 [Pseudomonas sp. C9]PWK44045.1 hypothetical protein C7534_103433 [Pseudomonas sp. OV226]UVL41079.1 DUF2092 domain-containing protein [Pseudomonas sp. B21-040]